MSDTLNKDLQRVYDVLDKDGGLMSVGEIYDALKMNGGAYQRLWLYSAVQQLKRKGYINFLNGGWSVNK